MYNPGDCGQEVVHAPGRVPDFPLWDNFISEFGSPGELTILGWTSFSCMQEASV